MKHDKKIVHAQVNEDGIYWMTGQEVGELTNWNFRDLAELRKKGRVTFKREGKKIVRYDSASVRKYYEERKSFKTA